MQKLSYDVALVGGGPVGCAAAAGFARRGAKVLLVEANPRAASRLAGEWIHPPGVDVLRRLDLLPIDEIAGHASGRGFVVFPDDGSAPIVLPYADGAMGLSCEHADFVNALRERVAGLPGIDYRPHTRVTRVEPGRIELSTREGALSASVGRIVGADGRSSAVREALGGDAGATLVSHMAGVELTGVDLPFEGFGHVLLGGPGPILMYRIAPGRLRACLDLPAGHPGAKRDASYLWDAFGPVLPEALRPALRRALSSGRVLWATNRFRPRAFYGRGPVQLVGDAVGFFHPLTAAGITMGLKDAECLLDAADAEAYQAAREPQSYVPELLANALYQVFVREDPSASAIRRAVYRKWRESAPERRRTMRLLACAETRRSQFGSAFVHMAIEAVKDTVDERAGKSRLLAFREWVQWPAAGLLPRALRARLRGSSTAFHPMPALVRPEPPRPAANGKPGPAPEGEKDVEPILDRAADALREGLGMLPWYAPERARDRIALCDADARRLLALGALGDVSDATVAARTRLRSDGLGSILQDAALAPAETIARTIEASLGDGVALDTLAAATALLLDRQDRDGRFGASIAPTHAACTALAALRDAYPGLHALEISGALRRARASLVAGLGDDGLFADGDRPLTATALAIEALIATGAAPLDPALRRAAKRLCGAQQADGSLVERGASAELTTAAVLRALVRSRAPEWDAIERAAAYVAAALPASSGAIVDGATALAAVQAARASRLAQERAASDGDMEFCSRSLLEVSRTFARPIEMLPGDLRVAVTCGYLLCRTADTIEDNATLSVEERDLRYEAFLAVLEAGAPAERFEQLWRGVDGPPAEIELCQSLGRVMRVFRGLPREMQDKTVRWVAEMTRGMQLYSHRSPGPEGLHALFTVEDLERYCYFVAGTVGHMLTDLFLAELGEGPGDARLLRENAESFGVGLQLVNILKDVTDDRERGWSFIPETVCAAQGIGAADLVDPERRATAHRAVAPLFDLARGRLDRALAYTLAIPREERAVRLFCLLPLWMAARTLLHARGNDAMFVAGEPVKISRAEVEQLIADCVQHCDDDEALRARYAALWSARAPMAALRGVVAN